MNKKQNNDEKSVNPIIAGVTGAVIGAGIAIAGAVILKDEKNRDKAKKVINNVKEEVRGYVKDLENSAQKKTAVVEEKLAKGAKKAKKLAGNVEKNLQDKAKASVKASRG